MNPNDIPRWLDEHGGAAGPPETDANGVTTHRARDGSYVTVFNGQVRMIGQGAQAQPAEPSQPDYVRLRHRITGELRIIPRATWVQEQANPSLWGGPSIQWEEVKDAPQPAAPAPTTPAATVAPSSGGNMDQQALGARIAELQRQYPGLKFMGQSIKDKTVRRIDPDSDQPVTETVRVPVVQWVDPKTGYTLTAEVEPGGGRYTVVDDRLIDANKDDKQTGGEAKPPETKDEGGRRFVWKPNPGGPSAGGKWEDVGAAPETAAERQAREANAPTQTQTTREVGGKVYTIITITPKPGQPGQPGMIVLGPDGKQVPGGIPGEPPKDTPTRIERNGKTYIQHVVQKPDGSSEVYFTDQSGARVQLPDDSANAPEPAGAPKPSFTVGDAAADLQKYQEWLNAEMRKPGATLTAARADQLLEARRKLWDTALSEQAGIVNAQQQAYRDQLAQRGQTLQDQQTRRNSATSIANQAQSSYGDLMDKMGANPGGASIAKAIQEARFNAAAFVDGLSGGGVPEIKMGPAYEQTNQMQLNPRAGSPVPAIPQPGAPTPTANGLGVGAVGNVPAPTGAPAPAPAQPVFRPAPVAPAPVQAAPPINQQARDTDYRTAPAPVSDPRDAGGYSGPPPMAPAFTPAPQWNPETDPMPDSPGAVSMAPMQPAPWFLAGSSNGRSYDPTPAIASLIADPNIDNDMLRQAVMLEYPGYDVDSLLGRRSA